LRGGSGSSAAGAAARSAVSAAPFVPSKREMASAAAAGAFSSAPREGVAPVRESFSAPVMQPENAAPKVSVPSFAPPPEVDVPASETPSAPAKSAEPQSAKILAQGLSEEQVLEICTAIQAQQKFLGELIEHGHRWELEGAELRIYFATDK